MTLNRFPLMSVMIVTLMIRMTSERWVMRVIAWRTGTKMPENKSITAVLMTYLTYFCINDGTSFSQMIKSSVYCWTLCSCLWCIVLLRQRQTSNCVAFVYTHTCFQYELFAIPVNGRSIEKLYWPSIFFFSFFFTYHENNVQNEIQEN